LKNAGLIHKYSKKNDWKFDTNPNSRTEERLWVYNQYYNLFKKLSNWGNSPNAPVIQVFHGTGRETPWKIVQTGFCTVATLDDGYYGQGIYFTSDLNYAKMYSNISTRSVSESYVMLAFASPGNIYPVREGPMDVSSLKGKAGPVCVGYQSHYVLVNPPGDQNIGLPVAVNEKNFVDELVLFQESQAVPKYLLVFRD